MPNRIDKVVTRSGDQGTTSLADGKRYPMYDPSIELVGVLDEANAALALVTLQIDEVHRTVCMGIQSRLFDIGAAVATGIVQEGWQSEVENITNQIEQLNADLEPLKEFVLPGGNEAATRGHLARTVIRRAERAFWQAASNELRKSEMGVYLNRVSDYLFVLSRHLCKDEVLWKPMT